MRIRFLGHDRVDQVRNIITHRIRRHAVLDTVDPNLEQNEIRVDFRILEPGLNGAN